MNGDWIDGFLAKATDVTKKAGRDVNYFYNIKKTEVEIAKVKHEIGKIYKAIGELVYNARNEENDTSNIDILCKQIDVKNAYIEELNKRIELYKEEKNLEGNEFVDLNKVPDFMKEDKADIDDVEDIKEDNGIIKIKLKNDKE